MPISNGGHPWGGERESVKKAGLRLPPPCRGRRDNFPGASWGSGSHEGAARRPRVDWNQDGGVGERTLSSIGVAEPSGDF